MADIEYDDPEEMFDGCECQYCAVGAPGCWRATGIRLKGDLKRKSATIAELKEAIRQTISACCGGCPSFDEGRYCTYIGPCNWKYLHTTLFGTSY